MKIRAGVQVNPAATTLEVVEELAKAQSAKNAIALQGIADGFRWWDEVTGGGVGTVRFPGSLFKVNACSAVGNGARTVFTDWQLGRRDTFGDTRRRRLTWETYVYAQLEGALGIGSSGAFTAAASYAGYALWFSAGTWEVRRQLNWGGADEVLRAAAAVSADWHKVRWQYTEGSDPLITLEVDGVEWMRRQGVAEMPIVAGSADGTVFAPFIGGRIGAQYNVGNRFLLEYLS